MTKGKPSNVPASVRQRLLNLAQQTNQDFGLLLTKYSLERLLYRLSVSPHRDGFVLKGALLFDLWTAHPHRPTRDLDLLGHGDSSLEKYRRLFSEICEQTVEDDGLNFMANTVAAEGIKDDEDYEGVRVFGTTGKVYISRVNSMPDGVNFVDQRSTADAKIKLFRSLFRGRDDVYPRRFESRKTGKSGYAPACGNEWIRGICEKPRIKCADCQHQRFLPITDEVIRWHLSGFDPAGQPFVAGIYPMLQDETCFFLAVDFDKEGWREDAGAYLETCRAMGITAVLERSR